MPASPRSLVASLAAAFALLAGPLADAQPVPGVRDPSPVTSRRFMIVAANPLAVDAGYAMLARGGSAVDAAIAAQLVLGLVEPQSSGLGGGGFMLVHDAASRRLTAYDGRETAPAAAKPDRFLDREGKPLRFIDAVVGGRSVGVPGTVALLGATHRAHGRLPWADLFAPAIALSEQGFAVSPRLAALLAGTRMGNDRARSYFERATGEPLRAGDTLRNLAYARTLRTLAAQGAGAFYGGDIASDVVATANSAAAHPGDLVADDLARYRIKVRAPVCGPYRGYRVCGMPLPSSGGPTVLQMLAMLEPHDLSAMGPASFWSTHFIAEAGRLAYADRGAYMADPDFVAPPPGLLDPRYLRERSAAIRPMSTLGRAAPGVPPAPVEARAAAAGVHEGLELASTSHLSVVDARGNVVSYTTTIENAFGSRLMTEGGFLLNNELTDFSFRAVDDGKPVANRVEAGKRPRSSMAPTIVYDARGRVCLVTGSPGGSSIINYVVKMLVGVIDWKLAPQAAIALPNFGSRNGPTELERGTDVARLADKLAALGHEVAVIELSSGAHAIGRTRKGWIAGADPRREGSARGN